MITLEQLEKLPLKEKIKFKKTKYVRWIRKPLSMPGFYDVSLSYNNHVINASLFDTSEGCTLGLDLPGMIQLYGSLQSSDDPEAIDKFYEHIADDFDFDVEILTQNEDSQFVKNLIKRYF